MATPYEILLRWRDGVFSGGHQQFIENGVPLPPFSLGTKDHPWPDVLAGINTDAISGHQIALDAQKAAESNLASSNTALVKAGDEVMALRQQVQDLGEQLRIAKLPPAEVRKEQVRAEMAEAEAKLAALKAEDAALLDPK